jgi:hypothetical protein
MLLARALVLDSPQSGKFEGISLIVKGGERVLVKIVTVIAGEGELKYPRTLNREKLYLLNDLRDDKTVLWDLSSIRKLDTRIFRDIVSERVSLDVNDFSSSADTIGLFDEELPKDHLEKVFELLMDDAGLVLGDQEGSGNASEIIVDEDSSELSDYFDELISSCDGISFLFLIIIDSAIRSTLMTMKLDLFHGEKRVTCTISKLHSFFPIYCRLLSDCFLMASKEDMDSVDQCLRERFKLSGTELKLYKMYNRKSLLKYCRLVIPDKETLSKRFQRLNDVCGGIICSKSGKPLYTPETWKACSNLLKHIDKDCLSDPIDVPIHFKVAAQERFAKDSMSLPLPRWTTCRGSSGQESYTFSSLTFRLP